MKKIKLLEQKISNYQNYQNIKIIKISKYQNIKIFMMLFFIYCAISKNNNIKNILNKFKNKAIVYGIVKDINKYYMLVVLFMEIKY